MSLSKKPGLQRVFIALMLTFLCGYVSDGISAPAPQDELKELVLEHCNANAAAVHQGRAVVQYRVSDKQIEPLEYHVTFKDQAIRWDTEGLVAVLDGETTSYYDIESGNAYVRSGLTPTMRAPLPRLLKPFGEAARWLSSPNNEGWTVGKIVEDGKDLLQVTLNSPTKSQIRAVMIIDPAQGYNWTRIESYYDNALRNPPLDDRNPFEVTTATWKPREDGSWFLDEYVDKQYVLGTITSGRFPTLLQYEQMKVVRCETNVEIDPSEFTLEGLGLSRDATVWDEEANKRYAYGEPEKTLKIREEPPAARRASRFARYSGTSIAVTVLATVGAVALIAVLILRRRR
jgi:hypothetical protein